MPELWPPLAGHPITSTRKSRFTFRSHHIGRPVSRLVWIRLIAFQDASSCWCCMFKTDDAVLAEKKEGLQKKALDPQHFQKKTEVRRIPPS
ncbi:hypothetical protein PoB_001217900 [Plakobranchus ocellatus]|uniref:Uncharacterized protein n=1 Tax=Plakobranchus ocellatus TaxID=259542 RepID=A0AAV3YUS6_9GAST|nr:hypothetical protein PoB_001217900 [Plakobranchus ocellatus]